LTAVIHLNRHFDERSLYSIGKVLENVACWDYMGIGAMGTDVFYGLEVISLISLYCVMAVSSKYDFLTMHLSSE